MPISLGLGFDIGSPILSQGGATFEPIADAYDFNFATQMYADPTGATVDPFALGLLTHSRSSTLIAPNAAGAYQTYASGVKAINDKGWHLRAKTRKNFARNINSGAVAGTPGTLPTGWVKSSNPSGITTGLAFGSNDPVLNLPYCDFTVTGTASGNTNIVFKWLNDAAIPGSADYYMASAWMQFVSGSVPVDGTSRVVFIAAGYGSDSTILGDRLLNRTLTEGPTRFKKATQNTNSRTLADAGMQIFFKSGVTYNFTVRIICPQFEQIESLTDTDSLPILNNLAAGTTYNADVVAVADDALAYLQGGAGYIEMTTSELRGSGIDFRQTIPLVKFNGSTAALQRAADGGISSAVTGTPATYRSNRTQFGWTQKQVLSWNGTNTTVASTSCADLTTVAAAAPTVTTVTLDTDGCIARLTLADAAMSAPSLAAYREKSADQVAYAATLGGLHYIAMAKTNGRTGFIVGDWREVMPGGMATGGLSLIDADEVTAYGGMGRDYIQWASEFQNRTNLDTKDVGADIGLLYCDYLIKKHEIDIHWTSGAGTGPGNGWGLSAVNKTGTQITSIETARDQTFTAPLWLDASYGGDLVKMAGASYMVGREAANANNVYNGNRGHEMYTVSAGQVSNHQITIDGLPGPGNYLPVDPYITPGVPASGLLMGVQEDDTTTVGAADGHLQAFCFRMSLTTGSAGTGTGGNWSAMNVDGVPPPGYDAARYELMGRYLQELADAGSVYDEGVAIDSTHFRLSMFLIMGGTATNSDLNNMGGVSIDGMGANWGADFQSIMEDAGIVSPSYSYAVATAKEKEIYWKWQESYQRGLFYWWAYSDDPRIPAQMAINAAKYGLPTDLYRDPHPNDDLGWNYRLYERETIRVLGDDVAQASDFFASDGTTPRNLDTLGIASYGQDSHHTRRLAHNDNGTYYTLCEGNFQIASGSTNHTVPLSAKWFMPMESELTNIAVSFVCSAAHQPYGSFRMEMTQGQMGQSLGIIHALKLAANDTSSMQSFVAARYTDLIRPALVAAGVSVPLVN